MPLVYMGYEEKSLAQNFASEEENMLSTPESVDILSKKLFQCVFDEVVIEKMSLL